MPPLLDLLTAATADSYLVEREIGRGGMGAVFLARDRVLDRRVAIKVLPPELAARTDLRERFLRETRTAAAFSHPHVVPVHAVEERGGLLLFVMGYVDGETLAARVARAGPLGASEATRLLREVAWALSYAHSQGVVHRDVKPDNILLERATGRALVTDFGIARVAAGAAGAADALGLTRVGEVVGTPQYMSPEQAVGDAVDGRSDLYALGVVGFFALTGRVPFDGASTQAVLAQQITRPAPDVAAARPDVPEALAAAVQRCLAKEPAERFPSGEALVEALDAAGAAHHDVAPALRLFAQRLETTLRALVILAVLTPVLVGSFSGGSVDALVCTGFLLAVMWGIARGLVTYAGELARKGFRYEDVRAAVLAVDAEQRDLRATLRATPGDAERQRRHRWRIAAAVTSGAGCQVVVFRYLRHVVRPGTYGVEPVGVVLSVLGMALIGGAFVTVITDPRRGSVWEWLGVRLWSSRVGRFTFRLAARRGHRGAGRTVAGSAAAPTGAWAAVPTITAPGASHAATITHRTPLAVFDALPRAQRAELHGLRDAIARLQAETARCVTREADLEAALAEARAGDGACVEDARRRTLMSDLERARHEAGARRAELGAHLEHVRVQLLRVRSGLAGRDELARECQGVAG